MPSLSKTIISAFIAFNLALPALANGTQFITGICKKDLDCSSNCCGFMSGKCAGPVIALERDGGCGFGDPQSNNNAAVALGFTGAFTPTLAGSSSGSSAAVATPTAASSQAKLASTTVATGTQFITGICKKDVDCASNCCGFMSGKCAGAVIALERDGGCGFGDTQSNNNAAVALGFTGAFTPTTASGGSSAAAASPAAASSGAKLASTTVATGTQFITGICKKDADCASGCCGFKSGKCAGPVVAQERDGGCGFGDAAPNDTAAKKLTGAKRGIRGWNL